MDRATLVDHLLVTECRIAQSADRVCRQMDLISHLASTGQDIDDAVALLSVYEEVLEMHRQDRDRLAAILNHNREARENAAR